MAIIGNAGETALAKAAEDIPKETETLLEPEKPVQMSSVEHVNGKNNHVKSTSGVGRAISHHSKAAAGHFPHMRGSDAHLEEFIRDSPFLDVSYPMTPYEWFKFIVMFPMFLFRCFLTVTLMPPVWLVTRLCLLGTKINEPIEGWRRAFLRPFLITWTHILLHIGFNIWPSVTGGENVAKAYECRATIVFNHVSYSDGIILGAYLLPCGLAKASVADIPFFGWFAKACSFLFVERKGSADEAKTVEASRGRTTQLMHDRAADPRFPLFIIAPEGTCKRSDTLLNFSTGAFVGGRPVLPVLLKYRAECFSLAWGRVESSLWHFMRLQTQFINYCDMEILPPYMPSEEEQADPRLYAENVRALMAERLGATLSDQGLKEQQMLKREGICVDWTGSRVIQKLPKMKKA